MANILNTRIRLKYDTLANWSSNNPTLLEGELAIVSIPSGSTQEVNSVSAPQILFKVGPGEFNSLPYASGKAADVYTWAKLAGADVFKKDGNGNVISGIEYDATANDGKGGFKFTTASVATSEGLEEVNNALAELMTEVYGEDGSANASRIDALEERMTAEENKVDNDTTYTFAKTEKGFSVTPKGGEAQTLTFEYLTEAEIKAVVEAYGYLDEEGIREFLGGLGIGIDAVYNEEIRDIKLLNGYDIVVRGDGLMIRADNVFLKTPKNGDPNYSDQGIFLHGLLKPKYGIEGYRNSAEQDAIDATFATKEELNGVDAKFASKQDTITDLETIRSGAAAGATAVQPGAIADMLTKTEAGTTYATKTELGNVDARFTNYNTKSEVELMISNEATRADAYANKAVSDFKDFLLGDGATDALDTIKDLSDALASHADEYEALLETVGKKADKTEVEKVAGDLNALENHIGYVSTDDKSLVEAIDERYATKEEVEESVGALDNIIGYAPTTDGKTLVEKIDEFYATKEEVEGVSKTVSDLSTSTDSRLDAIEAQLGLGGGDSDTGSVTEQLAAHALTLEDHEGRIAANEGAIKALNETTVPGLASRIGVNETSIKTINETTIPGLDSRIKTLEDNPYELPSDVVQDANYKHITVTETSVSDGTTTFTKYDDTELAGKVNGITERLDGINSLGSVEDNLERINTEISSVYGEIGRIEENINLALDGDGSDLGIYGRLSNAEDSIESINGTLDTVNAELYGGSDNNGLVNRVDRIEEDINLALNGGDSSVGIYDRLTGIETSLDDIGPRLNEAEQGFYNCQERLGAVETDIADIIKVELYGDSTSENPGLVQRVEEIEAKKVVEYYESEQPDYTKDMFVICCGSSSDLI